MAFKRCGKCNKKTIHTYKGNPFCKMCQMLLKEKISDEVDFKPRNPNILFYDIETTPLKAWIWRLGEQVVRPHQLDNEYSSHGIICIGYQWNDGKPSKVIGWGYKEQNTEKLIKQFDKIAEKADYVIGKNSNRFDVKHINTQRLLAGMTGTPSWLNTTDDVEQQFRKNFYFPSYSLDYLSKHLLKGRGKDKMEFEDWTNIVEKKNHSSYKKMLKYCKRDVESTKMLWDFANKHFKSRLNLATFNRDTCCRSCGSKNIKKNGTRVRGKTVYQMFFCNDHGGYAGEAPINLNKKTFGKIG